MIDKTQDPIDRAPVASPPAPAGFETWWESYTEWKGEYRFTQSTEATHRITALDAWHAARSPITPAGPLAPDPLPAVPRRKEECEKCHRAGCEYCDGRGWFYPTPTPPESGAPAPMRCEHCNEELSFGCGQCGYFRSIPTANIQRMLTNLSDDLSLIEEALTASPGGKGQALAAIERLRRDFPRLAYRTATE